ncbi:hypothetical protein BLOT_003609 [Blomia tropicalis]|nr:hypothetical protein BLOT_003609 [Blomia tropicalis]
MVTQFIDQFKLNYNKHKKIGDIYKLVISLNNGKNNKTYKSIENFHIHIRLFGTLSNDNLEISHRQKRSNIKNY